MKSNGEKEDIYNILKNKKIKENEEQVWYELMSKRVGWVGVCGQKLGCSNLVF